MRSRPMTIRSYAALDAALDRLCTEDPRLDAVRTRLGTRAIPLRRSRHGFATILRLIVYQQISLQAARAIWARLVPSATPEAIAARGAEGLARIGLSKPKIRYALAIAEAVREERFAFAVLPRLPDDDARAALIALPGIGPWSAEIYLLSALARADAFPAGDLALQEAARRALALKARPSTEELGALAEKWWPHRSAAARLLWTYYRAEKGF